MIHKWSDTTSVIIVMFHFTFPFSDTHRHHTKLNINMK